ncbi:DUF1573 domain-containing protein [Pedobacter sp. KLB.chiD]|uniref:DUF1573 domain-containing protein n=1 Tax=Pedobacter sp. KLB.chiD TaxID=3387402 RepID=UPI00399A4B31
MNKKQLYIVIVILIFAFICLLTYKTSDRVIFRNKQDGLVHHFGTIKAGNVKTYTCLFKYVNIKYPSIRIYGVKDACDCTESMVATGNYKMNDTISIMVKYNPTKYNDSGLVVKKMFLITNQQVSKYDTLYPLILTGNIQ